MYAVSGYIDDGAVVLNEKVNDWQGRNVVVTILDSTWNESDLSDEELVDEGAKNAALQLAGLWSSHDQNASVYDTVRNMRRGRQIGI